MPRSRGPSLARVGRVAAWAAAALLASTMALSAEPIVLVQSLPMSGPLGGSGTRVLHGSRAYISRINAEGGIGGRMLELLTLDDEGDPARHAANLRTTITERHAVAILACVGERLCETSAALARELRVPLVGALSGTAVLGRDRNPWVFRIRAGYGPESTALAAQLKSLGCSKVALVSDARSSAEQAAALRNALGAAGLILAEIALAARPGDQAAEIASALPALAKGGFDAVIVNVDSELVERAVSTGIDRREEWPRTIVTTAVGNLHSVLGGFKQRVVGFSTVVPNPEASQMVLARELQADAEKYANSHAVTFDGMEAYIAAKLLVKALRGAPASALTGVRLTEALAAITNEDIGGFVISFAKGRESGSNWVDVGVRSRAGLLLR